ncbi:MAG: hypothetical protein HC880_07240 [Bacteroidia bacterium]|nr:hypothetical protein [Bacteroidia bacterium]
MPVLCVAKYLYPSLGYDQALEGFIKIDRADIRRVSSFQQTLSVWLKDEQKFLFKITPGLAQAYAAIKPPEQEEKAKVKKVIEKPPLKQPDEEPNIQQTRAITPGQEAPSKIVVYCPDCRAAIRIPANKYLRANCSCGATVLVKNGLVLGTEHPYASYSEQAPFTYQDTTIRQEFFLYQDRFVIAFAGSRNRDKPGSAGAGYRWGWRKPDRRCRVFR